MIKDCNFMGKGSSWTQIYRVGRYEPMRKAWEAFNQSNRNFEQEYGGREWEDVSWETYAKWSFKCDWYDMTLYVHVSS